MLQARAICANHGSVSCSSHDHLLRRDVDEEVKEKEEKEEAEEEEEEEEWEGKRETKTRIDNDNFLEGRRARHQDKKTPTISIVNVHRCSRC